MAYSLQKIFSTVVNHLATQNKKSMGSVKFHNNANLCRYWSQDEDGTELKCAVGVLITPDVYTERVEGVSMSSKVIRDALVMCGVITEKDSRDDNSERVQLLTQLQLVHDDNCVSVWGKRFAGIAAEFGLVYNEHGQTPMTQPRKAVRGF